MLTILALLAALFVGAAIGVLLMARVCAGVRDDRRFNGMTCHEIDPTKRYVLTTSLKLTPGDLRRLRENIKATFPETVFAVVTGMGFDELPETKSPPPPVDPEPSGKEFERPRP